MITKQKARDVFDAKGYTKISGTYDWSGVSDDTPNLPTEGVATNDKYLELDTGKGFYFDGSAWQPIGG